MGTPPSRDPEHAQAAEATGGAAPLAVSVASLSDVGRVRSENQDGCGVFRDSHGNQLLVVADGMGGHRGGATASRVCVETLGRVFQWSPDPVPERLQRGLVEANRLLHSMAAEDSSLSGMGTTAVALSLGGDGEGWVAWAGDSRLYRLREGRIEPLTQDHSLVAEWVRLGVLRPEEAAEHPRRNELMRCVGPSLDLDPDVERIEIRPGDRFLLCSDGLWGEVSDPEIGAVLGAELPERAVRRLVDLANERGGPDNVTVQIAVVAAPGAIRRAAPAPSRPAAPAARSRAVPLAAGVALAAILLAALLWLAVIRGGVGAPEAEIAALPGETLSATEELAAEPEPVEEPALEEEQETAPEPEPEPAPSLQDRAQPALAATSPPPSPPEAAPKPEAPRAAAAPEPFRAEPEAVARAAAEPEPLARPAPAVAPVAPARRASEAAPPKPAPVPAQETATSTRAAAPQKRLEPAPGAPLPPRPEFRDVAPGEPAPQLAPQAPPAETKVAAVEPARPDPAGAGALARIEAFLAEWTRSVETFDFALYHRLGLPQSREDFEQSYGQRKERSLRFAVLEHTRVAPDLLHVRVSMSYSYRTSTDRANYSREQKLVLREVDGGLRYVDRLQ